MHPVYGDKGFMKPTEQVWWKKMLGVQKFASGTEVQSVVLRWLGQLQPTSIFAPGIQKVGDRWDRNRTMLKSKTIMFNN